MTGPLINCQQILMRDLFVSIMSPGRVDRSSPHRLGDGRSRLGRRRAVIEPEVSCQCRGDLALCHGGMLVRSPSGGVSGPRKPIQIRSEPLILAPWFFHSTGASPGRDRWSGSAWWCHGSRGATERYPRGFAGSCRRDGGVEVMVVASRVAEFIGLAQADIHHRAAAAA